jgi:TPR repeat protein
LVSLSESGDSICLGYLMIVLSGVYKHPSIPTDRNRAAAMGTGLWSQFQSQEKGTSTSVNPHVAFHLGFISEFEMGTPKNLNEAAKYYHLASDQGHAQAQCNLGGCYYNGTGVRKDESKAVELYRLAADQGHAGAQCNLGWCYANGTGVRKDESKAVELYRLASDQGNAVAQSNLSRLGF